MTFQAAERPDGGVRPQKWWLDRDARLNGIFKGGGAKGLMYAGALQAVDERGYWFDAVAGSSAGAITATLIAAGLTVEELGDAVPEAMGRVRRMWLGDLVASPLIQVGRLRQWLDERLRAQVLQFTGEAGEDEVSFGQLHGATGIDLYVVSVDVALRQPAVFSPRITPDVPIAPAVMASSAIPIAFRPGRLRRRFADGSERVHRLMDGGVWANYPAFVFKDASFRAHHDLPPVPADSVTVGFTLDSGVEADAGAPVGFADRKTPERRDRGSSLKGALRFGLLRVYLMTIVPLVIVAQVVYTLSHEGLTILKDYGTLEGVPAPLTSLAGYFDGFFTGFTPGFLSVVAVIAVTALVLAIVGATLIDSGIPAIRTLMAVGTDVPYWVGTTAGDHVVRLRVPPGIDTTSFKLPAGTIADAIDSARRQATPQIESILGSRVG